MPQIDKQVLIDASTDQVWQVLADFSGVEKWAPTVSKSRLSSAIDHGVGAKRTLTTTTGHVTEEVIVEWEEGRSFTFEIPDDLASVITILRETWTVEHSSQQTQVKVTMNYQLKDGIVNSLVDALFVRRTLTKMLVQNLAGLKHHVETGEMVTAKTAKLPVASVV